MQSLIDKLLLCAESINMSCNVTKTVCMVINPLNRSKMVMSSFPLFKFGTSYLQFVSSFRYLGHIMCDSLCDKHTVVLFTVRSHGEYN